MNKKLVVLDLDETLLHACHEWIGKQPSFVISNATVHLRPSVDDFIGYVELNPEVKSQTV